MGDHDGDGGKGATGWVRWRGGQREGEMGRGDGEGRWRWGKWEGWR